MSIELIHGDCLDVMPTLAPASIDLILADLPYGTTACKWDQIIPLEPLWAEYRRVLKPRGAVVLTASQPFTSMLVMSNQAWFRYCLVWEKQKGVGFLGANKQPLRNHEEIVVFYRQQPTYNPQKMPGDSYFRREQPRVVKSEVAARDCKAARKVLGGWREGRFPKSVFKVSGEGMNAGNLHPTQKPVALMEYLIRTYSNEGDTVLDNAAGSGTTLVACLNTGRHGVGIEKDAEIFETARKRIAAAQRDHAERLAFG